LKADSGSIAREMLEYASSDRLKLLEKQLMAELMI
jgi:hypothetical protein